MMELGSYSNSQGGRICLDLANNAQLDTMFGTLQHEAAHAWLTGTTLLGTFEKLLYMETVLSADVDTAYSEDRRACVRVLTEYTRLVQEIYANNMELLTTEQKLGREEMLRALKQRPPEYQNCFMEMWPVHQSELPHSEKQRHIHAMCCYAMNPPLQMESLQNARSLAACLQGKANPVRRLKQAISSYRERGTLPEKGMDELDMLRCAETALVYVRPYLREAIANFDHTLEHVSKASAIDTVDRLMMDKICLFEPQKIRTKRVWNSCDTADTVFLVMKNVQNLQNEDNFYLLRYHENSVGEEVDGDELRQRIGKCVSVCTLMSDYDWKQEKPVDFEQGQALLTVLIQTSGECAQWLRSIQGRETVCVGELRAAGNQTDISILFFCLRGKPEKVYVFPTLRAIRNRLFTDFGLEDQCHQAGEAAFLSLLSWLKDEVEMLKYIQGLLQLLLNRSWQALQKADTLGQFIAAVGNNLANQALRFKRDDHYKVMAALPLKDTQDAPLFTLMRFEGERNTGDTYADSNFQAPFLFPTKASADAFAMHWAKEYSGVGVDRVFWPYFKGMLPRGKVILVLDAFNGVGKLAAMEEVEKTWYRRT